MQITNANLRAEYFECQRDVDAAIARCIANSSFINGPEVDAFEEKWAAYTQSESCVGVSSCTAALKLSLVVLGVKPGDEVIVPSMSFISPAEVVSHLGATPVFIDVDDYYTLDINLIPDLITDKTKAIICVDLYGQGIDIDKVRSVAKGIPIVEDCAQASGAKYKGKIIGSEADLTCFSFYPGKNLAAMGDAGAVTGSKELTDKIRVLRNHGRVHKFSHDVLGWNDRLDGLQAAIIAAKIPSLDKWNFIRQFNAREYSKELYNVGDLVLPKVNTACTHVFNQYVIQTNYRDSLREFLAAKGIETGLQYPIAIHQQPIYGSKVSLPRTEELAKKCISLPVHSQLDIADVLHVCNNIKQFYSTLP